MEENEEKEEEHEQDSQEGPGKLYEPCIKNEDLVDKLKLLDYEEGFLKMNTAFKPIHRYYFVQSKNVGEQFFMFTSLAAWLIRKCGNESYEMPQEFDDPNATIAGIMGYLRSKDVPVDFPANKLKSGAGDAVLYVLDALADAALIHIDFRWQKMIPPEREDEDVAVDQEDEDEDEVSEAEEEDYIDEDEGVFVDLSAPLNNENQENPMQAVLHSNTDATSWYEEVERVTPLLKITIRQDAKDWRMHLEQMGTLHKAMSELVDELNPKLEEIADEVEKSLERIETRERTLNQQLGVWMGRYKESQDARAEVRERYKSASGGVTERTATLQRISEDIDQIKMQIEEQGAKTSDGAPMMKVKQAILKIEEEIQRMNVQIGVLEQNLLQTQLKERVSYAAEAYGVA
ncbi:hypothetical protein V3C99_003968 [Haemonchus contortus]|uniref:Intraflagellar transport protein 57 homolog n=1 Tax=Haemonchus contortus TaxID=6289 RepID=A0A7I4XXQ0_HAECO|nr:Intra-flagellar transport protein 57 domain containing protein [Haemonchus contortus]